MAKILFGAVVADARGKLGTSIFSNGIYGPYLKFLRYPDQPKTSPQTAIKSTLTANAKGWSSALDQGQRDDWISFAATITLYGLWSLPYVLTGIAMFIRINSNLKTIGVDPLTDPPADQTVSDLGGITMAEVTGPPKRITLTTTNSPPSNEQLVVLASKPQALGRKYVGLSTYRIIAYYAPSVSQPIDVTDEYSARYGIIPTGMVLPFACQNIRNTNGAKGDLYKAPIILT
jgi:hypothetical protein